MDGRTLFSHFHVICFFFVFLFLSVLTTQIIYFIRLKFNFIELLLFQLISFDCTFILILLGCVIPLDLVYTKRVYFNFVTCTIFHSHKLFLYVENRN